MNRLFSRLYTLALLVDILYTAELFRNLRNSVSRAAARIRIMREEWKHWKKKIVWGLFGLNVYTYLFLGMYESTYNRHFIIMQIYSPLWVFVWLRVYRVVYGILKFCKIYWYIAHINARGYIIFCRRFHAIDDNLWIVFSSRYQLI